MSKTQDKETEEQLMEVQPFKFYLRPDVTYKIVSTKWGTFSLLAGVVYIYHLIWAVAGVNAYTDQTRKLPCGGKEGDEAS